MRTKKQLIVYVLFFALLFNMLPATEASAAKKISLSTKKLTVTTGKSKTLKVKNTKKKVTWKVVSGKKYITLKKKGKVAVTIKGKKNGKAKVQAKIGKKKLTCTVIVNNAKKENTSVTPESSNKPVPTESTTPTASVTPESSNKPAPTESTAPTAKPTESTKPTGTTAPTPENASVYSFYADSVSYDSLCLNWSATPDAKGYKLVYSDDNKTWKSIDLENVTSYTIENLKPDTTYYCKIAPKNNKNLTGDYTAVKTFVTTSIQQVECPKCEGSGKCPTCNGTLKVTCGECKGTKKLNCTKCGLSYGSTDTKQIDCTNSDATLSYDGIHYLPNKTCSTCGGKGYTQSCTLCNDTGKIPCPNTAGGICEGRGVWCTACYGNKWVSCTRTHEPKCTDCKYGKELCSDCNGKGQIVCPHENYIKCSECDDDGKVKCYLSASKCDQGNCAYCGGTGELTQSQYAAPTNLRANAAFNQIEICWDKLKTDKAYPDNYRIEYSTDNKNWNTENYGAYSEKATISGLEPNTKYYYRVVAIRNGGEGKYSETLDITTPNPLAAPSGLQIKNNYFDKSAKKVNAVVVTLSWNEVADAEKYEIECSAGNVIYRKTATDKTEVTFSDLQPDIRYYFTVRPMQSGYIAGNPSIVSCETPEPERISCTACEGTGRCILCKGTGRCPTCNGTGQHKPWYLDYPEPCVSCLGLHNARCTWCNGEPKCKKCEGVGYFYQ